MKYDKIHIAISQDCCLHSAPYIYIYIPSILTIPYRYNDTDTGVYISDSILYIDKRL